MERVCTPEFKKTLEGKFKFLYPLELSLKEKIVSIAKSYGAASVDFSEVAEKKLANYEKQGYGKLPICMAKTHLSLSADATAKVSNGMREYTYIDR